MDEQVHLGTVGKIRVGFHWSLLAIFGLIVVSLAAGQLPYDTPGRSAVAYVLVALVVGVLFFGSLLAHELAHALVAKRRGVEVEGIVLWLLGGVARLGGEPADPATELRIAAVGPAVSLALAGLFFAACQVAGAVTPGGLVADGLGWLGWMNLLLAGFNLLPAYPLDGGRVLRALLWRRRGDRRAATWSAARVGRGFGIAFIGLGAAAFFVGAGLSGLWLALVGWFLASAARSELSASTMAADLDGCRVGEAMTPAPYTLPAWTTLDRLVHEGVTAQRRTSFPVVDLGARFVGLVTLAAVQAVPSERWAWTTVGSVARPAAECVTCRADDDLLSVARRMASSPDRRAVVLDDAGAVVGILTASDVRRVVATRRVVGPTPPPVAPAPGEGGRPGEGLATEAR